MAINDPRDIPALVAWYSAEAETGYADGAEMTGWTDQSGLGNHATLVSSTNDPKWRSAGGPNSGASVEFVGTGQNNAASGYFVLGSIFGSATAIEAMFYVQAGSPSNNGFCYFDTGGDVSHYPFSGVVYDRFGSTLRKNFTPSLAVTSWRRYNTWSAASDWAARLDETSQHTTTSNTVQVPTAARIGAGPSGANDWRFGGRMTCVLLFNAKLTTTERSDLDDWLVANPSGGVPSSDITVSGDRWTSAATMLDGTALTAIWLPGEAFTSAAVMLDGTPTTGMTISGESFVAAATMLDGDVKMGITIAGEAFVCGATMLDGTLLGSPTTISGESFSSSATMLDGSVLTGSVVTLTMAASAQSSALLGPLLTEPLTGLIGTAQSHAGILPELANTALTIEASAISDAVVSQKITLVHVPVPETDAPMEPEVYIPSGDRFGDPIVISGSNGTISIDFTGSGVESGETAPVGVTKTIWLVWETDEEEENPRVIFDSADASIIIGNAVDVTSMVPIWDGEGSVAAYPDALSTYRVQLGWRTGDPDTLTLSWESDDPPFYDEFATPFELVGDEDRANLSTEFCTLQSLEPVPLGAYATAWSRWRPDNAGDAVIETSDPALVIRVFEDGPDITSLTLVASGTGIVSFVADAAPYFVQICDMTEPGT